MFLLCNSCIVKTPIASQAPATAALGPSDRVLASDPSSSMGFSPPCRISSASALRIASAVFAVRLVGGPIGCQFVFSSLFFFFSFFRLRLDALVAFSAFLLCSGSHAS
jgi:hypothetical protein